MLLLLLVQTNSLGGSTTSYQCRHRGSLSKGICIGLLKITIDINIDIDININININKHYYLIPARAGEVSLVACVCNFVCNRVYLLTILREYVYSCRQSRDTDRQACCCRRCRRWRKDAAASPYGVCRGTCRRRSSSRSAGDGTDWRRRRTVRSTSVTRTWQQVPVYVCFLMIRLSLLYLLISELSI